jgi:DNA-binding NtrC family response regulator
MLEDKRKILVIDDSLTVRESLLMIFKDNFDIITSSYDKNSLQSLDKDRIDLVIIGIAYPLDSKMEFLQGLIGYNEDIAVLIMVEDHRLKEAYDIFDYSISDFVLKPFSIYDIREKVKKLLNRKIAVSSLSEISHISKKTSKYRRIFNSPLLEEHVTVLVAKALNNNASVLIRGEYGSGHERVAKTIHYNGLMKQGGFFKLNCNLNEESFVNTLLEIKKDLSSKSPGTLLLEEIGEANTGIQVRLLEIIEEQTIPAMGKEVDFNLRLIASTSMDLLEKVNNREFREDLFYRINTMPIRLSPLRERRESISMIVDFVLDDLCKRMKLERKSFSLDALNVLKNYYWPGNLIELESVIIRSVILSDKEIISSRELSFGIEDKTVRTSLQGQGLEGYDIKKSIRDEKENIQNFSFDSLVFNLAHEVKNPLVSIKTFTQLLPERFEDAEFRGQFFQLVGESVDRIDSLMKRIIGYAQFSEPEFSKVNLYTIIENAYKKISGKPLEDKSIFIKGTEKDLPSVLSDKNQLSYVFDNILSKAISVVSEDSDLSLAAEVSCLNKEEMSHLAGLEQMNNNKAVEVTIPLTNADMGISHLTNTPFVLGLEIFLAKRLVDKSLGVMEVKKMGEGETVIKIKLPVALGEIS